MEIFINNAILHIADKNTEQMHISNEELDIDSDICYDFVQKHVKKLLSNSAAKEALFNEESKVLSYVKAFINGEIYFKDLSKQICEHLFSILHKESEIPPADVLIVQFETRAKGGRKKSESILENEYIAVLKLNHTECFTHKVSDRESGTDNQLVKVSGILPFEFGKVLEACVIPYEPMVVKILEKPYCVEGETVNYFSEQFLECKTELSKKEIVEVLTDISEEINEKYFDGRVEDAAKIKLAIIDDSIEQEGVLSVFNVASKVFSENEEAKTEFMEMTKEAGIKPDLELGEKFIRQNFGVQKFKAANGIELKFPAELSDDLGSMEFIKNEDGTFSILLKNLIKQ